MTTAQSKIQPAPQVWEPYPELPPEPKDMQQTPPTEYLRETLQGILTPEYDFPYHPTILIGSQIPIYYGERAPGVSGPPPHVIPDCLVAFDVDTAAIWNRIGYDPIQNGKPPDFAMEVASRSTHRNDALRKREIYRQIGVLEYWRFDPTGGRHYGRAIIGEHLVNEEYEEFPLTRYADGAIGATSPALGVEFRWRESRFRVHHVVTGEEYQHPREDRARLATASARLEAENELLRVEIERLRRAGPSH